MRCINCKGEGAAYCYRCREAAVNCVQQRLTETNELLGAQSACVRWLAEAVVAALAELDEDRNFAAWHKCRSALESVLRSERDGRIPVVAGQPLEDLIPEEVKQRV